MHVRTASRTSSSDRHEVIHADALHDEKLAWAVRLAVHVMRGLRRHCAALTRREPIDMTRCPRLDDHRPLKTNEAVADLGVVMPRYALSRRKGQHLHTQIGTLGYQLAASDRIIARLRVCIVPSFPTPRHCRKYRGWPLAHSRRPWQQGFACERSTRSLAPNRNVDNRNLSWDRGFESAFLQRRVTKLKA